MYIESSHLINKELRPTECNQGKEEYKMDTGKGSHKSGPLISCRNGECWIHISSHLTMYMLWYITKHTLPFFLPSVALFMWHNW